MYECFKYLAEEINSDVKAVCGSDGDDFSYYFHDDFYHVTSDIDSMPLDQRYDEVPKSNTLTFSSGAMGLIYDEMNRVEPYLADGNAYSSNLMLSVAGKASKYICKMAAAIFISRYGISGVVDKECVAVGIDYFREKLNKHHEIELNQKRVQLYLMQSGDFLKVGISDNPTRRINDMQTGNPIEITLLQSKVFGPRTKAEKAESRVHNKLKALGLHVRGEWFNKCDEVFKEFSKVRSVK
tara:strand:+ start:4898 stop:5614 length:717 start_codon:yes stop_codon:yes gene_type:complete